MDSTIMRSFVILFQIYSLFLSNFGLGVRGFSLRSCYLFEDSAICSQNQLTQVPTDIPPTVTSIDLRNNNISKIQLLNFRHFPNVTKLDLNQNSISNIGKHTFSQLISLKLLILSNNTLVKLEDQVFDGLSKLIELRVSFNQIDSVAPNAFRSLKSLSLLDLSSNRLCSIAQLRSSIQHMPQLSNLIIKNNRITTLRSQDLSNSSTIYSLDVSENPLTKFEVTTGAFSKLKRLIIGDPTVKANLSWSVQKHSLLAHVTSVDVSGVELASMDEWRKLFATFQSLNYLQLNSMQSRLSDLINMSCSMRKLSNLQIQKSTDFSIKSSLFQMCKKVNKMDLQENKIKQIENGSFAHFDYLKELSLSKNSLPSVPFATRNIHKLRKLKLAFNQITELGCQDFSGLTNLKELDLQGNHISALSNCSFVGLLQLEILKLQENALLELGTAFQNSLSNLKVLYFNLNKLTVVPKRAFTGLRSLTKLSLAQNQIQTLEEDCFFGLTSLMDLQLHENKLKKDALDSAPFKYVVNLKQLNLQKNHIKYGDVDPLEEPPFMNLSHLENFMFSVQHSTGRALFPSNFLQGLTNLLHFSCNNIQLLKFPDEFFTHTPHLISLDFGANDLFDLSPNLFAPISNLTKLRVTSTNLRSLDFLIHANLTNLKILLARKNTFSVINEDAIKSLPSLTKLDLEQNSFTCDCDNSWFVQWIVNNNQTQVAGAHNFTCSYPPQSKDSKLLDLNVQSCLVDIGFICFISSSCLTVVTLVASFIYHFSRFQLTYAYYIFLAWLFDSKNRKKRAACRYDAFVSYNAKDEAWVYRELVPHLEQEQGWRLCLHHRDFLPGKPIVENIADAIYGSRKTICVISRRYLQSEWCSKEMQLASFRLFDEREDVLILLFLEDIPVSHVSPYYRMKRLLRGRSYLSWPRAADNPQLFWEKLRQALRSTTTAEEDRLRLTVNQMHRDSVHLID
uniref:Toll-like receptor 22c n=1 Tax=Boleophthalmus pectinirostris TaxID=150288 RepID=A0A482IBZ4_BOLPE|nr:toll-like receptor 22c [Boleophthalmus pectinirostris]